MIYRPIDARVRVVTLIDGSNRIEITGSLTSLTVLYKEIAASETAHLEKRNVAIQPVQMVQHIDGKWSNGWAFNLYPMGMIDTVVYARWIEAWIETPFTPTLTEYLKLAKEAIA